MILVTGGIKSGKSTVALNKALKYQTRAFLATGVPFDEEMKERIRRHQEERRNLFDTYEEPVEVSRVLRTIDGRYDVVVFECLTTYLGNLYYYEVNVQEHLGKFIETLASMRTEVIIVTNEVGWGIIPENKLAREFAETLGKTNAKLAKLASEVYLVVAGIEIRIK
ncbi:adenosylcobinamide kinase /adenosylcobinamide-phosphate guanylyltransferase [Fervidobacterium changbaicum]|uniref:Adenosylcobinamide kinase n=2 Tax=Fervidobacterium TaxID=2422 RepID=A0AAI8CMR5_FERIS|nr:MULTISPECIES: bifunctional adenosylcobinamide kinase/adenosylcobinamide-phosphate guanylyltransferase [Fervidobacterium]AMW33260.1 bifunctional adenosylcobinamide kinase/adenosylcobinamide-phosphate guanylyltransferase [Fervidobacterium islandicum]QAV33321.1 bifunctional adenosylcobinamide kinase/adenosylcobinamide-phosphate guanylyltransferase [Fervidobacterium changbaicum]SDH08629.1 adenosylcobinamide kinase /adenosylcobinamide-phosphate guanylyltransferase [Fervidobacterium changbaicum]